MPTDTVPDTDASTQSQSSGKSALLVVDVQYDFLPGGSLAVTDGDAILPVVKEVLDPDKAKWDFVVASQDFHPPGHISFAWTHNGTPFTEIEVSNPLAERFPGSDQPDKIKQMLWPDHCVQGSRGCEIEESVSSLIDVWVARGKGHIEQKGTDPLLDAYSAFSNYTITSTAPSPENSHLSKLLQSHNITSLYVIGLATDYCVRASALDALSVPGVREVSVIWEGVRAVGGEEATKRVWEEMVERGVNDVRVVELRERGLLE